MQKEVAQRRTDGRTNRDADAWGYRAIRDPSDRRLAMSDVRDCIANRELVGLSRARSGKSDFCQADTPAKLTTTSTSARVAAAAGARDTDADGRPAQAA